MSSSFSIIGVDPSLADTGLCFLEDQTIVKTHHIPTKSSQELPQRLLLIQEQLEAFVSENQTTYLAVEDQFLGSFYTAKAHGIHESKNLKTIQGLSYVKGLVLALAGKYQRSVISINVSQWRSRFLPRKNMAKHEIMAFLNHTLKQNITNHNISDAILIGLCGQSMIKEQQLFKKSVPTSDTNTLVKRPILS